MSKLISLLERISFLKNQVDSGKKSLLEEDLESLFLELKGLISSSELETSVQIMDNGTIILEQKLEELRQFISFVSQKNKMLLFFKKNPPEEIFSEILKKTWCSPLFLPQFSQIFLIKSYEKLVLKKNRRKYENTIERIPFLEEPGKLDLPEMDKPFKIKMLEYFRRINSILPATLELILSDDESNENYYENFSYLLHLLKLGFLTYNNTSKQFFFNENKNENENLEEINYE